MISISDPVPSGLAAAAVRPGRRRQPARPARPPHLAAHRTGRARRLPHPGAPAHLPDRRPAPPGTHPGRRAARHRRPLVGGPGSADQRPGPRHPQPRPRAAVRPAAPLRHTADPHRRPRSTAPRARRHGWPATRSDPWSAVISPHRPARGRRPARGPGRPASRSADALAESWHRRPCRPAGGGAVGRLDARVRHSPSRSPAQRHRGEIEAMSAEPHLGGTHPPGPEHRAARTRRPGRGSRRGRSSPGPGPAAPLQLPVDAVPGAARRHHLHLGGRAHNAGAKHGGDRLRLPTRLAGLNLVGRRHHDDRPCRAAARRPNRGPAPRRPTDSPRATRTADPTPAVRPAGRTRRRHLRPRTPGQRARRAAAGTLGFGDLPVGAEQAASAAVLRVPRRTAARAHHRRPHRLRLARRTHPQHKRRVAESCAPGPNRPAAAANTPAPSCAPSSTAPRPRCSPTPWSTHCSGKPPSPMATDERPAARRALQTALALAEPLDALRPLAHAGPRVRELLVHQHGSFRNRRGPCPAGTRRGRRAAKTGTPC